MGAHRSRLDVAHTYQPMEVAMRRRDRLATQLKWAQQDYAAGRATERGLAYAHDRWRAAEDAYQAACAACSDAIHRGAK